MARIKKWRGKEVSAEVMQNVAAGFSEFGLEVEGNSKRELERGHGVESGTLRRSIHVAQPGYVWQGDDVEPAPGTPERGGHSVKATIGGNNITLQVGSGLNYALPVHQGHHSFAGYHYITNGLEKAKKKLKSILEKHKVKG